MDSGGFKVGSGCAQVGSDWIPGEHPLEVLTEGSRAKN